MEFLIIVDIFSIILFERKIYCQDRLQKLNLLINWISWYESNAFLEQIAKSDKKEK